MARLNDELRAQTKQEKSRRLPGGSSAKEGAPTERELPTQKSYQGSSMKASSERRRITPLSGP
jgi:hypothetical protein